MNRSNTHFSLLNLKLHFIENYKPIEIKKSDKRAYIWILLFSNIEIKYTDEAVATPTSNFEDIVPGKPLIFYE